jgi:hypothetical protein
MRKIDTWRTLLTGVHSMPAEANWKEEPAAAAGSRCPC